MSPTLIRIGIGAMLLLGALVHGLHITHATRSNLLLRGIDIVLVAGASTLVAAMFRRGERGEAAAGWGAVGVGVLLVLAMLSI